MRNLFAAVAICFGPVALANNFSHFALISIQGFGVDGYQDLFLEFQDNDRVAMYKDIESQEWGCHGALTSSVDEEFVQFVSELVEERCKGADFSLRMTHGAFARLCNAETVEVLFEPRDQPSHWYAHDATATLQRGICAD